MFKLMREDMKEVFARDPAARSMLEVLFCYPGLHALWFHRLRTVSGNTSFIFWVVVSRI